MSRPNSLQSQSASQFAYSFPKAPVQTVKTPRVGRSRSRHDSGALCELVGRAKSSTRPLSLVAMRVASRESWVSGRADLGQMQCAHGEFLQVKEAWCKTERIRDIDHTSKRAAIFKAEAKKLGAKVAEICWTLCAL